MIIGKISKDFPDNVPFEVHFNSRFGFSRDYFAPRLEGTYRTLDDLRHQVALPGRFFVTGDKDSGYQLQSEIDFQQYQTLADLLLLETNLERDHRIY